MIYVSAMAGASWIQALNPITGMKVATYLAIEMRGDFFHDDEQEEIEFMLMLSPDAAKYVVDAIVSGLENPPPEIPLPGRN